MFQSFWNHFEFANLEWTDAEKFLMACSYLDNVLFSTASEADEDLDRHYGQIGDVWEHLALARFLEAEGPIQYWESHAGS